MSHAEGRAKSRAEGQAETDAKRIVDAYKYLQESAREFSLIYVEDESTGNLEASEYR